MAETETPRGFFHGSGIMHYYGDVVREIFVALAVLTLIAVPLAGDLLPVGWPTEIVIAIGLIFLAGFTNPHSATFIACDMIVAALGIFFIESTAITHYQTDSAFLFFLREVAVILLLFAFYHSVKTTRAFAVGKIGKNASYNEFSR